MRAHLKTSAGSGLLTPSTVMLSGRIVIPRAAVNGICVSDMWSLSLHGCVSQGVTASGPPPIDGCRFAPIASFWFVHSGGSTNV